MGNIPPEARGDAKWCDARVMITLDGGKCYVGRSTMSRGAQVGYHNTLMGSVHLYPCYVVLPVKIDNINLQL